MNDATPTDLDPELHPHYRPNVGIVLINGEGKVWLGRRTDTSAPFNWQFPQGGVDEGEDLEAAARRELQEETGVTSARVLGRTDGWIAYDFPAGFAGSKKARGFRGQRQVWFALRFTGDDTEVDLTTHGEPEFDRWRWADLGDALDRIAPFKREAYGRVMTAFARYAVPVGA